MMNPIDYVWCWWHYVCPKHLIEKHYIGSSRYACTQCTEERRQREAEKRTAKESKFPNRLQRLRDKYLCQE